MTQSLSVAQGLEHALPSHLNGAHGTGIADGPHIPAPLHTCPLTFPAWQVVAPQLCPSGANAQLGAVPTQVARVPQPPAATH
jgi:hypothetical protein